MQFIDRKNIIFTSILAIIYSSTALANNAISTKQTKADLAITETTSSIKKTFKNMALPQSISEKIHAANISDNAVSIIVQPLPQNPQDSLTKPIINHFPHIARTPASTQKLIPTFIALDVLGKDFTWQTKVYQKGLLVNGTLHGDLLIKASGDPKLNTERLNYLFASIQRYGIQHIQGDIIIDNSIFNNVNFNPNAFDGQGLRAYNAPPNGFLVNFGTIQLDFIPSGKFVTVYHPNQIIKNNENAEINSEEEKKPTTHFIPNSQAKHISVRLLPTLADFTVPTKLPAKAEPCGKVPAVKTRLTEKELILTGEVSANCGMYSQWMTFPNSDSLVKKSVKGTWQKLDPEFKGLVRLASEPATSQQFWQKLQNPLAIVSMPSFPLSEQIWDINHFSNNVMTEQVTLSLPVYANYTKTSDYPTAFAFINHWWQQHLPNSKPPFMTRGSGLCRECQVEPASMLDLLNYAYRSENFETFYTSMAVAGVSGTMKSLKKRQPDSPAIGRAWIKTGTLNDVTSMVGYVKGHSGTWYAVVGMVNAPNAGRNYLTKAILDEMLAWTALQ